MGRHWGHHLSDFLRGGDGSSRRPRTAGDAQRTDIAAQPEENHLPGAHRDVLHDRVVWYRTCRIRHSSRHCGSGEGTEGETLTPTIHRGGGLADRHMCLSDFGGDGGDGGHCWPLGGFVSETGPGLDRWGLRWLDDWCGCFLKTRMRVGTRPGLSTATGKGPNLASGGGQLQHQALRKAFADNLRGIPGRGDGLCRCHHRRGQAPAAARRRHHDVYDDCRPRHSHPV